MSGALPKYTDGRALLTEISKLTKNIMSEQRQIQLLIRQFRELRQRELRAELIKQDKSILQTANRLSKRRYELYDETKDDLLYAPTSKQAEENRSW